MPHRSNDGSYPVRRLARTKSLDTKTMRGFLSRSLSFSSHSSSRRSGTGSRHHQREDEMNVFGSDLVTKEFVLEELKTVRKNAKIVKLELEDLLSSHHCQGILPTVKNLLAASDRVWKSVTFVDGIEVDDLAEWQLQKNTILQEYRRTYFQKEDLPLTLAHLTTFQANVRLEEGTSIQVAQRMFQAIQKDQQHIMDLFFSGPSSLVSKKNTNTTDEIPNALSVLFLVEQDALYRLGETISVHIVSGTKPQKDVQDVKSLLQRILEALKKRITDPPKTSSSSGQDSSAKTVDVNHEKPKTTTGSITKMSSSHHQRHHRRPRRRIDRHQSEKVLLMSTLQNAEDLLKDCDDDFATYSSTSSSTTTTTKTRSNSVSSSSSISSSSLRRVPHRLSPSRTLSPVRQAIPPLQRTKSMEGGPSSKKLSAVVRKQRPPPQRTKSMGPSPLSAGIPGRNPRVLPRRATTKPPSAQDDPDDDLIEKNKTNEETVRKSTTIRRGKTQNGPGALKELLEGDSKHSSSSRQNRRRAKSLGSYPQSLHDSASTLTSVSTLTSASSSNCTPLMALITGDSTSGTNHNEQHQKQKQRPIASDRRRSSGNNSRRCLDDSSSSLSLMASTTQSSTSNCTPLMALINAGIDERGANSNTDDNNIDSLSLPSLSLYQQQPPQEASRLLSNHLCSCPSCSCGGSSCDGLPIIPRGPDYDWEAGSYRQFCRAA